MDPLGGAAADATLTIKAKEGNYYVLNLIGHEHLGQMYEYVVELAEVPEESLNPLDTPEPPDLAKLIGTSATVSMNLENSDEKRHFFGFVTKAKRGEKRGRYTIYTITLRPGIWFMTQSKDSKVFQEKTVKEVISEIFQEYTIDAQWDLKETYSKLDYCVQYNETDYDFVHRLLEEAGIYYHFEHDEDAHKMVLRDSIASHEAYPTDAKIKWRTAMSDEPTITAWYVQQEVRTAEMMLTEYDFLAPATKNEGTAKAKEPPEMLGKMDWFEHPARVVQNSVKPDAQPAATPLKQRATVRMEELQSCYASATGTTNVRPLGLGMTFDLENENNEDDDGTYVLVSAIYRIDFGGPEAIEELKSTGKHEGYLCDFLCVKKDGPNYRTPRVTPRPMIAGPQTALVVGASGNEIETDKHGRIKVQFHWDRLGKKDQNSSCWVRVAQPWAGKGYGFFSLPRVGDEVVVHFLDGDPDRPLVLGAVYNNENMMAWKLPEQKTLGGFKSRTTDKGDAATANELRFEDKKNNEYIWFHAERDFHRQVEHDAFDWVGNNESVKVTMTRKEAIGKNWFMDVTEDVMHNFGKDLHVNVAGDIFYTGEATFQLKLTKDFNAKVDGDVSIEAAGKITLKAASIILEGSSAVTLKSGGSTVNLAGAGVDIVGSMVKVNSGGGGAGASPGKVDKAKKEDSITPEKKSDYEKTFDDPLPESDGGTGANKSKAS
jgi:type VI secretion system secreted protein VgrG